MRSPILGVLFLTAAAAAQVITLPLGPVAPGSTVVGSVFNNTSTPLYFSCGGPVLSMQHSEGAVISHYGGTDCVMQLLSGMSMPIWLGVPASGPGSNGSFIARWQAAAVRIDVGTPSTSFPSIHVYPANVFARFDAHRWDYVSGSVQWAITNTGSSTHLFGATDVIRVFSPGGTVPLITTNLAGFSVPAQFESVMTLALPGLPAGPYTVEATWLDPATNFLMTQRHGIQGLGKADLNLPGGSVIPSVGALPVELRLLGFPALTTPLYAFCVGVAPGSTPVPGVHAVPLVLDAAVMASLADGIGGLLVNNVGATAFAGYPDSYHAGHFASGIGVTHPGPAFSGMTVRCAAVAFEPVSGQFGASQGEDLLIQ